MEHVDLHQRAIRQQKTSFRSACYAFLYETHKNECHLTPEGFVRGIRKEFPLPALQMRDTDFALAEKTDAIIFVVTILIHVKGKL